jgi:predicted lipoprotein with Yx(FWY)xxD motif
MMTMGRVRVLGLLAAAVLVVGAGCGDDDDGSTELAPERTPPPTETEKPEAEEEATPEETEPEEDQAGEATAATADTSLGTVLVDAEGMTLYMFDPDEQGASTCYEDCESAWPPLTVDAEPIAGEGVDQALLGTAERDDGTLQVTYNDWPLYTYSPDAAAGDVSGQGVNSVWWVIGPDGAPIRD